MDSICQALTSHGKLFPSKITPWSSLLTLVSLSKFLLWLYKTLLSSTLRKENSLWVKLSWKIWTKTMSLTRRSYENRWSRAASQRASRARLKELRVAWKAWCGYPSASTWSYREPCRTCFSGSTLYRWYCISPCWGSSFQPMFQPFSRSFYQLCSLTCLTLSGLLNWSWSSMKSQKRIF